MHERRNESEGRGERCEVGDALRVARLEPRLRDKAQLAPSIALARLKWRHCMIYAGGNEEMRDDGVIAKDMLCK